MATGSLDFFRFLFLHLRTASSRTTSAFVSFLDALRNLLKAFVRPNVLLLECDLQMRGQHIVDIRETSPFPFPRRESTPAVITHRRVYRNKSYSHGFYTIRTVRSSHVSDPPLLSFMQEASLCLTTNCFNPTVTPICVFKSSSRMRPHVKTPACYMCIYASKWQLADQLAGKKKLFKLPKRTCCRAVENLYLKQTVVDVHISSRLVFTSQLRSSRIFS